MSSWLGTDRSCLLSQNWPHGTQPPSDVELVVWSYLLHRGVSNCPPKRWEGYESLANLLSQLSLPTASVPLSSVAIRSFVERCYTNPSYRCKGRLLRRHSFAAKIDATLIEYKARFVQFGTST
jgi:hypothetical protein